VLTSRLGACHGATFTSEAACRGPDSRARPQPRVLGCGARPAAGRQPSHGAPVRAARVLGCRHGLGPLNIQASSGIPLGQGLHRPQGVVQGAQAAAATSSHRKSPNGAPGRSEAGTAQRHQQSTGRLHQPGGPSRCATPGGLGRAGACSSSPAQWGGRPDCCSGRPRQDPPFRIGLTEP